MYPLLFKYLDFLSYVSIYQLILKRKVDELKGNEKKEEEKANTQKK